MKIISKKASETAALEALTRLAAPQAIGRDGKDGAVEIMVPGNRFSKAVLTIAAEIARHLAREELIVGSGGTPQQWMISKLGRARLKRLAADDAPFRAQHQSLEEREMRLANGAAAQVRVNHAESPLAWLVRHAGRTGKPLISLEQFAAGERLRRDFTLANLGPHVTALWGLPVDRNLRRGGHDSSSMNDTMIAAKDRVWAAIDAVGPDLGGILLQVCCHLNGLAEAERQLGWPARSAKVVLRIALERLAAHYGIHAGVAPVRPSGPGQKVARSDSGK